MQKLPFWVLANPRPSFYDVESATVQQMTARVYGAMNELIDEYNAFSKTANEEIESFTAKTAEEQKKFMTDFIKTSREFMACINSAIEKAQPQIYQLTVPAASWAGTESPYTQPLAVPGATHNSLVKLNMSFEDQRALCNSNTMFYLKNDNGNIEIVAFGDKPTSDLTIQIERVEANYNE